MSETNQPETPPSVTPQGTPQSHISIDDPTSDPYTVNLPAGGTVTVKAAYNKLPEETVSYSIAPPNGVSVTSTADGVGRWKYEITVPGQARQYGFQAQIKNGSTVTASDSLAIYVTTN